MLLNLECRKLKGLGKLMHILKAPEGEARLDAKHGGSARLLILGSVCWFGSTFNSPVDVLSYI